MELTAKFTEIFSGTEKGVRTFFAPGRVNIIGEHVDYNGGYVLPCAINMGTYALIRKRGDGVARFASMNSEQVIEIPVGDTAFDKSHGWANYPKGILHFLCKQGEISGFDILFSGNIPSGAGLSSSASIEMATAVALNDVFSLGLDMLELVKTAQRCENEFCGVNCGIMDMFAIGMGKKECAMYLHCDRLHFEYVPLRLGDYKIIIIDTNKRRKLNESKYNERRLECEKARGVLKGFSTELFEKNKGFINDGTILKRAKHVVSENQRVKQAVDFLKNGDINALGQLLTESHISLRDDYEVSCLELNTVVALALKMPGCIGARMTGAGFGGCAIALTKNDGVTHFIKTVSAEYKKIIGRPPTMYIQESGDGAREI